MYWKRPKMSVLPYLLVFFSDTELLVVQGCATLDVLARAAEEIYSTTGY